MPTAGSSDWPTQLTEALNGFSHFTNAYDDVARFTEAYSDLVNSVLPSNPRSVNSGRPQPVLVPNTGSNSSPATQSAHTRSPFGMLIDTLGMEGSDGEDEDYDPPPRETIREDPPLFHRDQFQPYNPIINLGRGQLHFPAYHSAAVLPPRHTPNAPPRTAVSRNHRQEATTPSESRQPPGAKPSDGRDSGDPDDEDPSIKVGELFKRCQALHRLAYPTSSVDFSRMDLTTRLQRSRHAIGKGHSADVYKGWLDGLALVGVKVLRLPTYHPSEERLFETVLLRFFRELTNWWELDHINVARLLGFIHEDGNVGLVSMWYSNGNVAQYLQKHPDADKQGLILDAAKGIRYLHTCSHPLIHGDLKAVNVLVDEKGVACIADFGISKQMNDLSRKTGFTTTSGISGTTPWMAPELLSEPSLTFASDIYSYGGLILEIMCPRKFPYHYLPREVDIILAKHRGELPDRTHYPEMDGEDPLWNHVIDCLANDPQDRPDISTNVTTLYKLFGRTPRASTLDKKSDFNPAIHRPLPKRTA